VNCPLFDNGRIEVEMGNGLPPFEFTLNDENPSDVGIYTNLSPGEYVLSVSDSRGCKRNYPFDVNVSYANIDAECPCQMFVPNAITPDENGLNDLLVVVPSCPITEYRIQIFDRWGAMVFESDDLDTRWNGGYDNHYMNPSVFYYRITYRWGETLNSSLELQIATGTVTVLR
jgi:gliding motility-associated-like protein